MADAPLLPKLLWLALAGSAGTLARWGLQGAVQRATGSAFPWGTLAVNVAGCFLFGCVWSLAEERMLLSAETRILLLVGFMGAFTTFSSFAFETGALLRDAQYARAAANVALQNLLGIVALFVGHAAGRAI